ncbi:hypothetical protein LUZ61_008502 [Rhynchospora tenuis]|uniref:DM2 domain-containing protein n=1 Tax=Rhynchospora tenuis TaxID=198213 RepID=A0AAD5ZVN8_9POAL|nr:hypothetical protein LUZ61_008502 [Rhynchospora tenuis]
MAALIRICLSSAFFRNPPSSFTRLSLPALPTRRDWLSLSVRANNDTRRVPGQAQLIKMKTKPELRAIIGVPEITSEEAAQRIRDYIIQNNLKNRNDSVAICDEKLKKLFGKECVDMFDIPELLIPHLEK